MPALPPETEPMPANDEDASRTTGHTFPIVGIGASAGGLAAIEAFFSAMPPDVETGMAFVIVQHLAPDHKSILVDLVKRHTPMEVFEVTNGLAIRPNCVYIIPPNYDMALLNGTLQLLEPAAPRGLRLPIDYFFRSLAQDQRERAICIVLSGTGSDGTPGVRTIKNEGGMVMVQQPDTTVYDGMPRSAIATGMVDYVLAPDAMPSQLLAYVNHAFGEKPVSAAVPTANTEDVLKKICVVLRAQTGHDFSQYKQTTILRRVARRMALHQIQRADEYVRFLQQNRSEAEALFHDLLIGVTNFFRDPEAFAALQETGIPHLFANKPAGGTLRVWVCGCSTGEEAYSVAILLQEHKETLHQSYNIQIFATDIDARAIVQARSGVFPASIAADVTPQRLARFFTLEAGEGVYRVQKSLRDQVIFSTQDLIRDPPFSRLDMLCCRNVLIYMNSDLQRKLIPLFHYALTPGGILFLGSSETIGEHATLFGSLDRKGKLYLRKGEAVGSPRLGLGEFGPVPVPALPQPRPEHRNVAGADKRNLRTVTEQALLAYYAQAAVLVNGTGEILHIYGRTGKFLEPAPGDIVTNILPMAREGLRHELTTTLHRALVSNESSTSTNLRVKTEGGFINARLVVKPVAADIVDKAAPALFLVLLEETPDSTETAETDVGAAGKGAASDQPAAGNRLLLALEEQLRNKEDHLQATLEEMETSNEELKSVNEEMQSVNEELQSTNEELETAKEEMQSVNEELATVNAELQAKVADLSRVNNDMNNLLAGTGVATLFLDLQLRIARFTPTATQLINFIPTDVGRPVGHIVSNLIGYDRLEADVKQVLDTLIPVETEVQTRSGAWHLMGIRPYRTLDNVIEGAVLTFVDITARKQADDALRRMLVTMRDATDAIMVYDLTGRILAWNRGAERMYGWSEAEALAMRIGDFLPHNRAAESISFLQQLETGQMVELLETQRVTKAGQIVHVRLTAVKLVGELWEMTTGAM